MPDTSAEHNNLTDPQVLYEVLASRLGHVVCEIELRMKAEVASEINRLKREKNAIILGHNYMEPALFHSVPDYTGDSLYLSRVAAKAKARIIVFCGVRFMAETAKILNTQRTVLIPSDKAGCSLAQSITAEDVRTLKRKYPDAPVVSYVNCYADVKAESDYCCTSGNATQIVSALFEKGYSRIIFVPDEYLAANTARELHAAFMIEGTHPADISKVCSKHGADQSVRTIIAWPGRCEVHEQFTVQDITSAREQYHDVVVLAHPECSPEVVEHSDFSGSTTQMLRYVDETPRGKLMLLTECAMGDNIASFNHEREILRLCSVRCPHMQEITLQQTRESLRQERFVVEVEKSIAQRARIALSRMIA